MTSNLPDPLDPRHLRVSDAERETVAERLRVAAGEGRLDLDELEERITAVYTAKTYADLEPITRDLPDVGAAAGQAPVPVPQSRGVGRWLVGRKPARRNSFVIMGGSENRGPWVVPQRYNALAIMGGIVLDLREAQFEGMEATINASCIMGGIEILVPEGLNVQVHGFGFMGGYSGTPSGEVDPNAPTVHVRGMALMGGVDVKRKAPKEPKQPKELRDRDRGDRDRDRRELGR